MLQGNKNMYINLLLPDSTQESFRSYSTICLLSLSKPHSHGALQLGQQLLAEVPQFLEQSPPLPDTGLTIPNKGSNFASSFYKAFYGSSCLK